MRLVLIVVVASLSLACGGTAPAGPGPADAGGADGGTTQVLPNEGEWTWLPVEGSKCASGATAGIGVNAPSESDDLLVFMQGGGACWNQGTCVPSLLQFGPICNYGQGLCLYDDAGGTRPTAVHVTHPNPFPADGGGVFPGELKLISSIRAFDREDASNPFRRATFVYVPYCTGDLHSGDAVVKYKYRHDLIGQDREYTFHFAGATNMDRYLERLAGMRPHAKRVWLTGSSAGGYGATLNFERVQRAFPQAEVALLADSSPLLTPVHWQKWRDTWNMQLPEGCTDCADGFPQLMSHLARQWPDRRLGLLAFEEDKVISWFFFGGIGPDAALNPPTGTYRQKLTELRAIYAAHPNLAAFVLPGGEHVMWGGYGSKKADGSHTAPRKSSDGSTDLKQWIDAWATASPDWKSVP